MRIGVFKRYWDKYKYNRKKREALMEKFDEADVQIEAYMGDDYKNWRDEVEGAREFLHELETKQVQADSLDKSQGNTNIKTIKGNPEQLTKQEIEYDSLTFNPFDPINIKTQEGNLRKLYIEKDNRKSEEESGLSLGTTDKTTS